MLRRVPDGRVLIILLLLLARYAWLATDVHPFGDDWSYAVKGREHGLWERLVMEYRHWNGRYFSNILVLRGPLLPGLEEGLWRYRLVPVVLIAGLVLSARLLLAEVIGEGLSSIRKWCAALAFTALYLHLMPHPGQGLFWYTGAVTYLVPCILLLVLLASLLRMERAQLPMVRWCYGAGVLLLTAAVAGSNEVAMVHALLLAMAWAMHQRGRFAVLLVTFAMCCAAAVYLAPGNTYRTGLFVGTHDPLRTVWMSAAQTVRFVGWWLLAPALLLSTFIVWRWGRSLQAGSSLARSLARLHPAWPLVGAAVAVLPAFVIPYWSTGMLGQHRTVNAALFVFLPLAWVALLAWQARRGGAAITAPFWTGRPGWVLVALLLCMLGLRNDGALSSDLLTGRAHRFDRAYQDRYALIGEAIASGADTVLVPVIGEPPVTLDMLELREDPGHWMNASLAAYLGAPDLRIIAVPTSQDGGTLE